jgi:GST-like protein
VEWKDGLPGFPTVVPPKGGQPVDLGFSLSPTPSVRLEYPPKDFSSAPWSYLRRLFLWPVRDSTGAGSRRSVRWELSDRNQLVRDDDHVRPDVSSEPLMPPSSRTRAVKSAKSLTRKIARPKRAKPKPAARKSAPQSNLPIELHYWPTPNGWKISIMLEECGLPYVVHPVDISKGEQFSPQFLAIAPNNRIPAIIDPNGPGGRPISVFESGAILQYLGRKTGQFYPRNGVAVLADGWARTDGGPSQSLPALRAGEDGLRHRALHQRGQSAVRRDEHAPRHPRISRWPLFDRRHGMVGWVRLAERMGQELAQFPHLKRWFETIRARPAVKRAFAIRVEAASAVYMKDPKVRAILFGQTAR